MEPEEFTRKLLLPTEAELDRWQRDAFIYGTAYLRLKRTPDGGFEISRVDPMTIREEPM